MRQVGYTHHTSIAPRFAGDVRSFWADLGAPGAGGGLQDAFDALGRVDVVINTAALSAPAACHRDPDAARCARAGSYSPKAPAVLCNSALCTPRAVNVPTKLLEWLAMHRDATPEALNPLSARPGR